MLWRSGQHNPRRCRNRTVRYSAIRDDAHTIMRAVTGFPRSLRQSCTSIPIHHSQCLRPTGELCRSHKAYVARSHLHSTNQRTHPRQSPLRCSVRPGCPLTMALFALCFNPLLYYLDTHLDGIRFGRTENRVAVVAYADVTIFVTQRDDFRIIRDALQCNEKASGERLNIQK